MSSALSVSALKLRCNPAATSSMSGTEGANSALPSVLGFSGFWPSGARTRSR